LSIIKHVTLQKIVAHDFRYDPRNLEFLTLCKSKLCGVIKKKHIEVGLWTADDIPEELNLQQGNEHFKSRSFMEKSTQCQLCL